ncbi:heat shock protein DNAj [Grosmannia clavigera kw1407]|uniref:Heat shock protein DNAj n=1 Tax=Grosmannia clavigera (strain kw1407 / UAMH 11150) TaxID=655863 RepID=F0XMG0_GROCL|nr:heat shock protein DNAj [Grosmannia clavigera kw1407]EFX01319.1 heat shock protein DNAj [Grosmannia clavigera kw1407]
MNPPPPDPYKALGVEKSADITTIKSAYRKLVLKCHPDKVQDPTLKAVKQDEFQRVQHAYEVLVDETKRREYDLDAKMRRMRAEAVRNPSTPRSTAKDYAGFNVRTAEPPPSFKPGPPPSYSPYGASSPLHAHSWEDRDMPYRSKTMYDEGRRARRATSYEKPRSEVPKEERRRQKEADEEADRGWAREREQREKDRREREKEQEKKARSEREKEEKREKLKREQDRRDRERDRTRRQEQQDKARARNKTAYVEHYEESDEERRAYSKKKTSASGAGGGGSSSSKKHTETPRRDRSARRDDEPRTEPRVESEAEAPPADAMEERMKAAADYMVTKRRGSKNNMPTAQFTEGTAYNSHFPDPDVTWHVNGASPRPRRASQEEKKVRRGDGPEDDVDRFMGTPERRPPPLTKSYTTPLGTVHVSNTSAPRAPPLNRAATMGYSRPMPPSVPPAAPETGRGKPERRRRGSFEALDEELRSRRPSANPRVVHYPLDESSPIPRTGKSNYYGHGNDYFPAPSRAKTFSGGQVYETKRYSNEDIVYSTVNHSADHHYSSSHPPFVAYD